MAKLMASHQEMERSSDWLWDELRLKTDISCKGKEGASEWFTRLCVAVYVPPAMPVMCGGNREL